MCKIWNLWFFLNEIFETTIRSDSVLQSCKQDERRMMSSLQRPRKAQSNPQVSKLVVLIFEEVWWGEPRFVSSFISSACRGQKTAASSRQAEQRRKDTQGRGFALPMANTAAFSSLKTFTVPLSMMPFCFPLSASPFVSFSLPTTKWISWPRRIFFWYLESVLRKNGDIDKDVKHRISAGWLKWC